MDTAKSVITVHIGDKTYAEAIENNIQPSSLTPENLKNGLAKAVGKRAFYAALRADGKKMAASIDTDFDFWKATKFNSIAQLPQYKKAAQKVIDMQIMIRYPKSYKAHLRRQREISYVNERLLVLVTAYENLISALQSIAKLTISELNIFSSGAGSESSGDFND
jgi:hypothetical protein